VCIHSYCVFVVQLNLYSLQDARDGAQWLEEVRGAHKQRKARAYGIAAAYSPEPIPIASILACGTGLLKGTPVKDGIVFEEPVMADGATRPEDTFVGDFADRSRPGELDVRCLHRCSAFLYLL
jgi:hypothetical protein